MNEHGLAEGVAPHPEHEVSVLEVRDRLASQDGLPEEQQLVLIDCREACEVELTSIEGSEHIPLVNLIHHADDLELDLPGGKGQPIAVLCRTGRRSLEATLALRAMGFADIRSVAGGIHAWSHAIDPSIPRY